MKVCLHTRTPTWLGVSFFILTLAQAANAACPGALVGSTHQITGAETAQCTPGAGESVEIKSAGSITTTSGPAVGAAGVVVGDVVNAGSLSSGSGAGAINVSGASGGVRSITNTGSISANSEGGIYIHDQALVSHGIVNSGLTTGPSGLYVEEGVVVNGGIVNTATGHAAGTNGSGIELSESTVNGGIVNAGRLSGTYGGLSIQQSPVSGGIVNSGAIIGESVGVELYGSFTSLSGGLQNRGTIQGADNGLYIDADTLSGGIVNRGRIEGTEIYSTGAYVNADVSGGLFNAAGAVISGGGAGLIIEGNSLSGGVVNSGDIVGFDSVYGTGLRLTNGVLSGGIANTATGRISGAGEAGVDLSGGTLSGGLHNAGLISGVTGIRFSGGTLLDGDIVNSGVISGTADGLRIDDTANFASSASKIVNTGVISGAGQSLNFGAQVDRVVENTGALLGDVQLGASDLHLMGERARVVGSTAGGLGSSVSVEGRFASEGAFNVQAFNITAPGRFSMNHDVTAEVTNNGTLAITAGTARTVNGNYYQAPGAVLEIGLESGTRYGQLVVANEAVIDVGASLHVDVKGAPSLVAGAILPDVLRANGWLSADSPAVTDNSYLFDFRSSTARDPLALDLVISRVPNAVSTAVGTQGNTGGAGAAAVIDGFIDHGAPAALQDVVAALGRLGSAAQVSDAVRQMLPAHSGAGAQATNNMLHGLHRIIQARTEDNRGLSSGDAAAGDRYLWVKPFINEGSQGARNGVSGFDSRSRGFVLGMDGATGERTRLGGSLAYVRSHVGAKAAAAPQGTDIDSYALIGYGTWKLDADTDINYQLDAAKNDNKGWRSIPFMATTARAGYGSLALHAGVGAGKSVSLADTTSVTPSVRLDYTRVRSNGYTESGAGGLDLNVAGSIFEELMLSADTKLVHEVSPGIKLTANAALGYDFKTRQAQATSAFSGGGPAFVTQGLEPSPWLARVGGGVVVTRGENTELTARYDAEAKPSGYRSHTLSLRWRKTF